MKRNHLIDPEEIDNYPSKEWWVDTIIISVATAALVGVVLVAISISA